MHCIGGKPEKHCTSDFTTTLPHSPSDIAVV